MKKLFLFFIMCLHGLIFSAPRVSIITSIYNGDAFIAQFMEEIVKQTIFDQCELIMINANSPGNEWEVIKHYAEKYPNIVYFELAEDPGLYGVWNLAVKIARGKYIMNANLDDGLAYNACEKFAKILDNYPGVDLVFADFYITYQPNQYFYDLNTENANARIMSDFSYQNLKWSRYCMPTNHPMWRKSIHAKYGYFDESYKAAADCEMWARIALNGSVFKRIPEVLGFFYFNPQGLSTKHAHEEIIRIQKMYD